MGLLTSVEDAVPFNQGGTASSIRNDANWSHNTTVSSCEDFHAKTCYVECVARGRVPIDG
ncbi:hypothetical protein [Anaplasma phagocytophilum]|uniref:hypothetical protein n=1 Tax=Anaplasma phagocytophilum TaxID=948 RepID=UPI00114D1A53|nr:hypothetical protein [Anaplasma phagocytophilum]